MSVYSGHNLIKCQSYIQVLKEYNWKLTSVTFSVNLILISVTNEEFLIVDYVKIV